MIRDTGIRPVRSGDIGTISTLIQNTLLISNGVDYDFGVIRYLSHQYSPAGVAEMARKREMYVYDDSGQIAGTISLGGNTVFGFFCGAGQAAGRSGIKTPQMGGKKSPGKGQTHVAGWREHNGRGFLPETRV